MLRMTLLSLAAAVVIGLTGLAHGLWTGRWHVSHDLERAVADLDQVPLEVGSWQGEAVEIDAQQFRRAGADGFLVRRYRDRRTGRALSIMMVCGRPGPISVHTPDVCYGGAGYRLVAPPPRVPIPLGDAGSAEFFAGKFQKEDSLASSYMRIFWAWRAPGGGWLAADNPRWTFARSAALNKLYLIREMDSPDERPEEDPAIDFLRQFLLRLPSS